MHLQPLIATLLTRLTLSSTAYADCNQIYGNNLDAYKADCPSTCFDLGGSAARLFKCGCQVHELENEML